MKRILSVLASAVILLPAALMLGGCGEAAGNNVETDQLPYGATVTIDTSRDITMSYDARFIEPELADKVYAYYHAVQTKNAEEFTPVLFPLYHDYQLNDLYEGQIDDQVLMESSYSAVQEYFGFDFEYSMIDITGAIMSDGISEERDRLRQMLDDLADDKDQPAVSTHTTYFYELSVTRYVTEQGSGEREETDYVLTDEKLYAMKYDDQWCLVY